MLVFKNLTIGLLILFIMGTAKPALATEALNTQTQESIKAILQKETSIKDLSSISLLSRSVLKLCSDSNGRMADIGAQWEATDAISDITLPRSRLIWAAETNTLTVVHCEAGGLGHMYFIVVADNDEKKNNSLDFPLKILTPAPYQQLADFIHALPNAGMIRWDQ